jgi:predicted  nucleic acid-binding Zn-ribbon protein
MDLNIHTTLDRFLEKYSFLDTKTHSLERSVQNLSKTSSTLATENGKLRADLAAAHSESGKLRAEAADARARSDKLLAEVSELQAENTRLRSEVSELKSKANVGTTSASQSEVKSGGGDVAGLQSELSNLRVEITDLQTRNSRLNVELVELRLKYEDVQKEKEDLAKAKGYLEKEKADLRKERYDFQRKVDGDKETDAHGNDFSELRVLLGTATMMHLKEPNGATPKDAAAAERDAETDSTGGDTTPQSEQSSTPTSTATSPGGNKLGHSESRVNFAENVAQEKHVPAQSNALAKSPSGNDQVFHRDGMIIFHLFVPLFLSSFLVFVILILLLVVTPGGPALTAQERRKSRKLMLSGEELKVHEIVIVQSVVRQGLAKRWLRRARM